MLKSDACVFLTQGLSKLLSEDKSAKAAHSCPAALQPFLRWAEGRAAAVLPPELLTGHQPWLGPTQLL